MSSSLQKLSWLHVEIYKTVTSAIDFLSSKKAEMSLLDNDGVKPDLSVFANYIHQIVGSLKIVEIDSIAAFAQELEHWADRLADQPRVELSDLDSLQDHAQQISDSVARMLEGLPELTLEQFEAINKLRQQRHVKPYGIELFFAPNLDVDFEMDATQVLDDQEYLTRVARHQKNYRESLLLWLKKEDEVAIQSIASTFSRLHSMSRFGAAIRLWWVAYAFADALRRNDHVGKRRQTAIFAKLNEILSKIAEKGESALIRDGGEPVVRHMLFAILMAENRSNPMQDVIGRFNLRSYSQAATVESSKDQIALRQAGLRQVQEKIAGKVDLPDIQRRMTEFFSAGRDGDLHLDDVSSQMRALANACEDQGLYELQHLANELSEITVKLELDKDLYQEESGSLHAATAIMIIDQSFSGEVVPDDDWERKIDANLAQLKRMQGKEVSSSMQADGGVAPADIAKLYELVEEEIDGHLRYAEAALTQLAENPDKGQLLDGVDQRIDQVRGALQMLGQQKLALLARQTSGNFARLQQQPEILSEAVLDAMAVAVSALMESARDLRLGIMQHDDLVERALSDIELAFGRQISRDDVETLIAQSVESYNAWIADNTDYQSLERLRLCLRDMSVLARKTDLTQVDSLLAEQNRLLDMVSEDPAFLTDSVRQTLQHSMARVAELLIELYGTDETEAEREYERQKREMAQPIKAADDDEARYHDEMTVEDMHFSEVTAAEDDALQATELAKEQAVEQEDDYIDPELIQVFIEECDQILQDARQHHQQLATDSADNVALKELRRQFHTLKGSGRTIGMNEVGELGWLTESLLNYVIDTGSAVNPPVLAYVDDVINTLVELRVDDFAAQKTLDLPAWADRAEALHNIDESTIEVDEHTQRDVALRHSLLNDEELRNNFVQETSAALQIMEPLVDQIEPGKSLCSDELYIQIHTVTTITRSLMLEPMASAYADLEKTLDYLRSRQVPLTGVVVEAAENLQDETNALLQRVQQGDYQLAVESAVWPQVSQSLQEELGWLEEHYLQEQQDSAKQDSTKQEASVEDAEETMSRSQSLNVSSQREHLRGLIPLDLDGVSGQERADTRRKLTDTEQIFVEEVQDLLLVVDTAAEIKDPEDVQASKAELLRVLHTIKGSARVADYLVIGEWSHKLEDVLEHFKVEDEAATARLTGVIRDYHDAVYDAITQHPTEREQHPNIALHAAMQELLDLATQQQLGDLEQVLDDGGEQQATADNSEIIDEEVWTELEQQVAELGQAGQADSDIDKAAGEQSMLAALEDCSLQMQGIVQTVEELKYKRDWPEKQRRLLADVARIRSIAEAHPGLGRVLSLTDILQEYLSATQANNATVRKRLVGHAKQHQGALETAFSSLKEGGEFALPRELILKLRRELERMPGASNTQVTQTIEDTAEPIASDDDGLGDSDEDSKLEDAVADESELDTEDGESGEDEVTDSADDTTSQSAEEAAEEAANSEPVDADDRDAAQVSQSSYAMLQQQVRVPSHTLDNLASFAGDLNVNRSQMGEDIETFKQTLDGLRGGIKALSSQLRDLEILADSGIERLGSAGGDSEDDKYDEFDPLEMDRYNQLTHMVGQLIEKLDNLSAVETDLNAYVHRTETNLQQQSLLSKELMQQILQIRLVPFSDIAPQLRQTVRQTAKHLQKKVQLVVVGGDVLLDKTVLNVMSPAIEHMLRNAVDHGVETTEQRSQLGKPEQATITIECRQEGKDVEVSIADDGSGLSLEKIYQQGQALGLLEETDEMDSLNDEALLNMIAASGFSTSNQVTQISGRGIGMDVVRETLRRLGGNIQLQNSAGQGVKFTLRAPISTAVSRVLFVSAGGQEYGVPMRMVERMIELPVSELQERMQAAKPVLQYADEQFHLIDLAEHLGFSVSRNDSDTVTAMLVYAGGQNIAVVVDEILNSKEMVVKSFGSHLSSLLAYAGAAIRADGGLTFVIDFVGLSYLEAPLEIHLEEEPDKDEQKTIMVVDDSLTVRKASQNDLLKAGFAVELASNGLEAQRLLLDGTSADLMLLDLEMPEMDGFELLEWIRQESDCADLPVIIISSRSIDKYMDKVMDLGANDFIGKPYQLKQLLEKIALHSGTEGMPN